MTAINQKIFPLKGKVQHYAWGGKKFIPELLGIKNEKEKPFAEYWMGAHEKAPSDVIIPGKEDISLKRLIEQDPEQYLGTVTAKKFGRLPYLFKVLDVKEMLSIQVHPTKEEAEKGFEKENEAGIPLSDSKRNYKDDNHKPEMMIALSEFWLLHGFLPKDHLSKILEEVKEFNFLLPLFRQESYYGLFKKVMEMPDEEVDKVLQPLADKIVEQYKNNELPKAAPAYWAAKAIITNPSESDHLDRGIFSIYFFNLVKAKPGDAVFQDAGLPHAYLEGHNIELMANSDNVLRGGLTPKHIDVPELLAHINFEPTVPKLLQGKSIQNGAAREFQCPVPDFSLSALHINKDHTYEATSSGTEIIFVFEGDAEIKGETASLTLSKGDTVVIFDNEKYSITSTGEAKLFKASIPEQSF